MVVGAERSDFAGNRPDHQHPCGDTAGHKIVVSLLPQGGLGDNLPIQFHARIITFLVPMGKSGNAQQNRIHTLAH